MVAFTTVLKKFDQQGEKTGWTYIDIPQALAEQLKPGNKKSFRVKGKLDNHPVSFVALVPMGGGDFIMAINTAMRKAIRKSPGQTVQVVLEQDDSTVSIPKAFLDCLQDEPHALAFFTSLAPSHQLYFIRWIDSAKTDPTRTKRIAASVSALARDMPYDQMLRAMKKDKLNGLPGIF